MKTADIAQLYLDYFEKNDHQIVPFGVAGQR